MSWDTDTDGLLDNNDGDGGTVVIVKNITKGFDGTKVIPEDAITIIETATVLRFPKSGAFKKMMKGQVVENTHVLFFPSTSSVAVDHRIFIGTSTDYDEVMDVREYDGHKQVYSHKVENK